MKHYGAGNIFWIIIGLILIWSSFELIKYSYYSVILALLGIFIATFGLLAFDLNGYGNLTFFEKGFIIGRKECNGEIIFSRHNAYIYDIIKINNITISKRFIIVQGILKKTKYFGSPQSFEDKLYKQNKQVSKVKIPRIYEKENEILAKLNTFVTN